MTIVPDEMPHDVAAFMRRVEKTLKPGHPSFALVVMDDDGRPHTLTLANRTGLAVAGTELLSCAVELERQQQCICANCDSWTARARNGLEAMGWQVPSTN